MSQLQMAPSQAPDLLFTLRPSATDTHLNGIEIDMEPRSRCSIGDKEYLRRKNIQRSAGHQKTIYTPGELNKLLDAFLHPLAKTSPDLLILDGVLHGIIERNPPESVMKFIEYSLPELLSRLVRIRKRK